MLTGNMSFVSQVLREYEQEGGTGLRPKDDRTQVYGKPVDEKIKLEPRLLYPSQFNNPVLTTPDNFGGQDGDRAYPIRLPFGRHNAGTGHMWDTRDFVNHSLDSRSNDYMYRETPDANAVQFVTVPQGFAPPPPNGTTNVYNPPHFLHGLPPLRQSADYFKQQL